MSTFFKILFAVCVLITPASARTWTDVQGRTIEAEIVRVDGDKVVVTKDSKEVSLKLSNLSELDQKYIAAYQGNDVPGIIKSTPKILLGETELKPNGEITTIETKFSLGKYSSLSKAIDKNPEIKEQFPGKVLIHVALPPSFNPSSPNRVVWISVDPNIVHRQHLEAAANLVKGALDAGFIVVIADSDHDLEKGPGSGGYSEMHIVTTAINWSAFQYIAQSWKEFPKWKFVFCGSWGGSQTSQTWGGYMAHEKIPVIGMFFDGASAVLTDELSRVVGDRKTTWETFLTDLKKIKVSITTEKQFEAGWRDSYPNLKLSYVPTPRAFNFKAYSEALAWFVAP